MLRHTIALTLALAIPAIARSEERFITIQRVVGNQIAFVESSGVRGQAVGMQGNGGAPLQGGVPAGGAPGDQRGRGMRGGGVGQARLNRGGVGRERGGGNIAESLTAIVPAEAKITAAIRERRTFEFRVGIELAGGLRHRVFTRMQKPLSARIVTQGDRITELNVITDDTDVNQSNTSPSGQTVIAVKPKRPPEKELEQMKKCIYLWALLWCPIFAKADDRLGVPFFEAKIRPVLVKHCYECHSTESGKARGGLKIDTREALLRGGDGGPAVRGRSAIDSLLYQAITYEGEYQMPPQGKLPDTVIADFRRWIEMGSPDPRITKHVPAVSTKLDVAAGRSFWAYQPPKQVGPPNVTLASWPRSGLDRFILAEMESNGLKPVSDAGPDVLVRRLFFMLTGLPPTPAAAEHWTAEIGSGTAGLNQEAIGKLVDGLLGTKFYGERWGRHWLDVARFAESTGGDSNNVHQHAWRYRDYVIDSFNKDKPFDRFIMEQVAGDLLPIGSDAEWAENIIASGFLAVGLKLVGEEDSQKFFADLVDEQIDTTTRAFLATTVACARCHDHKADPIPQSDYYALAGIFRATETHYGLIKAQARQATTLIDITGLGPEPDTPALTAEGYAALVKARDDA